MIDKTHKVGAEPTNHATATPGADAQTRPGPKISIFLPTAARFASGHLQRAIASVERQSFANWELLCVDDGSVDGTREFLGECSQRDARIKHLRLDRNYGLPAFTLAKAWPLARGEFFAWLFDDCEFIETHLTTLLSALEARPEAMMVYAKALATLPNGASFTIGGPLNLEMLFQGENVIPNVGVLLRRKVLETIGWYDPHVILKRLCDWDLWQRIAKRYPIEFVDEVLAIENGRRLPDSIGRRFSWDEALISRYSKIDRNARLHPDLLTEADCFLEDIGFSLGPQDLESLRYILLEHAHHTADWTSGLALAQLLLESAPVSRLLEQFRAISGRDADEAGTLFCASTALLQRRVGQETATTVEWEGNTRKWLAIADERLDLLRQHESDAGKWRAIAAELQALVDSMTSKNAATTALAENRRTELAAARDLISTATKSLHEIQVDSAGLMAVVEEQKHALHALQGKLDALHSEAIARDRTVSEVSEALAGLEERWAKGEQAIEDLRLDVEQRARREHASTERAAMQESLIGALRDRLVAQEKVLETAIGRSALYWNRIKTRRH
jgi:Glycosyl transferase family 2